MQRREVSSQLKVYKTSYPFYLVCVIAKGSPIAGSGRRHIANPSICSIQAFSKGKSFEINNQNESLHYRQGNSNLPSSSIS